MTQPDLHLPLTNPQRSLLSFLSQQNRCLYEFLEAGLMAHYGDRQTTLQPLIRKGWVENIFNGETFEYQITDLGKSSLEKGLQLDEPPKASALVRFNWFDRTQ